MAESQNVIRLYEARRLREMQQANRRSGHADIGKVQQTRKED